MNELTRRSIALYLAAVFVAGVAAGTAGGYYWGRQTFVRPPRGGDMTASIMRRMTEDLQLRPEQVDQIEPIIAETSARIRSLNRDTWKQVDAAMQESNRRVEAFLDDAQKARKQAIDAERKKRWERDHASEGSRGPKGDRPPPGTPPGVPPAAPSSAPKPGAR